MKIQLLAGLLCIGMYSYGQTTKNKEKMEKSPMEVFQTFGQGLMS